MIYYFFPEEESIKVAVDVNGAKGPNHEGRDLFFMAYCTNGKLMPSKMNAGSACSTSYVGDYKNSPLYHLIQNGWKMDY